MENIDIFPFLRSDKKYKITSPCTRNYNCISWANECDNVWTWPPIFDELEDDEYWPSILPNDTKIETFVKFFMHEGFSVCTEDESHQQNTIICLYEKDGECTHAARKLPSGMWTSKLGPLNDIQHSTPHSLEGEFYGKVFCYMKRENNHVDMLQNYSECD